MTKEIPTRIKINEGIKARKVKRKIPNPIVVIPPTKGQTPGIFFVVILLVL